MQTPIDVTTLKNSLELKDERTRLEHYVLTTMKKI